jgi:hypothetical protein
VVTGRFVPSQATLPAGAALALRGATLPEVAAAVKIGMPSVRTYKGVAVNLLREQLNGRQPRNKSVNTGSRVRPQFKPLVHPKPAQPRPAISLETQKE